MTRVLSFSLLLALCLQQAACMTAPRPIPAPRSYIPIRHPSAVWMTDANGQRVRVDAPQVITDTLFGLREDGQEIWIALADIPLIEARQPDRKKTYALLGGITASVVLAIILAHGTDEPIYEFIED
jgi:hypothetical protein